MITYALRSSHLTQKYQGPSSFATITRRVLAIGNLGAENRNQGHNSKREQIRTCENLLAARCRLLMPSLISH
jgi:hypothetical protein